MLSLDRSWLGFVAAAFGVAVFLAACVASIVAGCQFGQDLPVTFFKTFAALSMVYGGVVGLIVAWITVVTL